MGLQLILEGGKKASLRSKEALSKLLFEFWGKQ